MQTQVIPGVPSPLGRPIYLDPARLRAHSLRNHVHAFLLVGALAVIVGISSWLFWGAIGLIFAAVGVGLVLLIGPRLAPEAVMRLYKAQRVSPEMAPQLFDLIGQLAKRAELAQMPAVYVVPSATLNAFAVGNSKRSAIAMTEGIIRGLSMRELGGVLGHEISHVKNGDLWIMGLADGMQRITRALSYAAMLILILNLPGIITGTAEMPWPAVLMLILAPTIAGLLQLGLSRSREYEADLDGATLTGDPEGLASALKKLDEYHGSMIEDVIHPSRRIPHPSVLRSHPSAANRIARLEAIAAAPRWKPALRIREVPMLTTLAGLGPGQLRPRYRWTGVWY
ncbi:MAG: M48 family metalloprotease [Hyphomicrobiaceae bacterium]|nr:MAG: M48 family metalloprotease [Hyphomicrobiaceae bacterium]